MRKAVLYLMFLMLVLGCNKDKGSASAPVYKVPSEFQPIVDSFIHEAALRGKTIVINNLIIQYDSTMNDLYCALANTTSLDPSIQKIISVNPRVHCYTNEQEKEVLYFHELGHCILGRSHDSRLLPNGDPRSIMVLGNIALYSPCAYPIGGACQDNTFKRTYYLDELFNEQTPVPDWAK